MFKIFIDGKEGTTGLRIYDRLKREADIELLTLPEESKKDPGLRREKINRSDLTFLCLPDDAARESVSLVERDGVKIIDASTAHRTLPGWAYGFPELSKGHFDAVRASGRVCVPGCHASGFIALVHPLVSAGVLPKDALLSAFSITGYSGGGNKMIAEYQGEGRDVGLSSPRQYATAQNHKHLREMTIIPGLENPPVFSPIVCDFYSGMAVGIPLHRGMLRRGATPQTLAGIYREAYRGSALISVLDQMGENEFLASNRFSGLDTMEILVSGNDERTVLVSRFDNLGKGASGAAIECMNIMLGRDLLAGLSV